MWLDSRKNAVAVSLSSLALILALSRCSPLAPSISKFGSAGGLPTPGIPNVTANAVHVFTYKTRVMDGEGFDSVTAAAPAGVRKIPLSNAQLSEFLQTGKTEIQLGAGLPPDYGQCLLEVTLSRGDIETNQLNSTFDTDLKQKDNGSWALSIGPGLDSQTVQLVKDHLVSATILLASDTSQLPGTGADGATGPTGASSSSSSSH